MGAPSPQSFDTDPLVLSSMGDERSSRAGYSEDSADSVMEPGEEMLDWVQVEAEENIYGFCLVIPLVRGMMPNGEWCFHRSLYMVTFLGMLANLWMQAFAVYVLSYEFTFAEQQLEKKIFGLCQWFDWTMNDYKDNGTYYPGHDQRDWSWDCGTLAVTVLQAEINPSNWSIDTNGDGSWSLEEAEALKNHIEALSCRTGRLHAGSCRFADLHHVFIVLQKMARKEHKSKEPGPGLFLPLAANSAGADSFTQLPMKWVREKAKMLKLCTITINELCGNLEFHDALQELLPLGLTANRRILQCKDIIDNTCPQVFGQRYDLFATRTAEVCGDPMHEFEPVKRINLVSFKSQDTFDNRSNGMVTVRYRLFLQSMMILWLLLMMAELRKIIQSWLVVLFMPAKPDTPGLHEVQEAEEKLSINAMPSVHRWITILTVLLPRSVLAVTTAWVGCRFLCNSNGFTDLLLNSVALDFLYKVDEALFEAVVSEPNQEIVKSTEPLRVEARHIFAREDQIGARFFRWARKHMMWFWLALLVALSVGIPNHAYRRRHGRLEQGEALFCMCQALGPNCISNRVLGGFAPQEVDSDLQDRLVL